MVAISWSDDGGETVLDVGAALWMVRLHGWLYGGQRWWHLLLPMCVAMGGVAGGVVSS